jgi:hypothetical protein
MTGVADSFESFFPPNIGYALVGRFLQNWSFVEAGLRDAITKALGLSRLQGIWVCANISFRDKINILKTAIDVMPGHSATAKADMKKLLDNIAGHSPVRNMIAHDMFFPSADGRTVDFFVVKAKGKFEIPDEVWDVARFEQEYALLAGWATDLKGITTTLSHSRLAEAIMNRMANTGIATAGLHGLSLPGSQTLPQSGSPDSDPSLSSDEKEHQSPPKPEQ